MKGRFITFEGIDGVGKSTQATRLAAWLRETQRLTVLETREPGGTDWGEELRRLILHGDGVDATTEVLLMFAARREHLRRRIVPTLDKGEWVICDRFTDSTTAYQGGGRGVKMEHIRYLADMTHGVTHPDLTFYLPSPTAAALSTGDDTFEREGEDFFRRVETAYHQIADDEPKRVVVIENVGERGRRGEEEIAAEICRIVTERLFDERGK